MSNDSASSASIEWKRVWAFFGGDNGIGLLQMTAARMSFSSNNTYVIYDIVCVHYVWSCGPVESAVSTIESPVHFGTNCVGEERVCVCAALRRYADLVIGCHFSVGTHIEITQYILPLENVETMCRRCRCCCCCCYCRNSSTPIIIKVTLKTTEKVRHNAVVHSSIRSALSSPSLYWLVPASEHTTATYI